MPTNIEIKARLRDLALARRRAAQLSAVAPLILQQRDTFFHAPRGRLKLREVGSDSAELIYYQRRDTIGPRRSKYRRCPIDGPQALAALLTDALGVRGVVSKRRELYRTGRTRIHLDEVEGLGNFLELEVQLGRSEDEAEARAEAESLIWRLGLEPSDLVAGAYIDLVEARHATNRRD